MLSLKNELSIFINAMTFAGMFVVANLQRDNSSIQDVVPIDIRQCETRLG